MATIYVKMNIKSDVGNFTANIVKGIWIYISFGENDNTPRAKFVVSLALN